MENGSYLDTGGGGGSKKFDGGKRFKALERTLSAELKRAVNNSQEELAKDQWMPMDSVNRKDSSMQRFEELAGWVDGWVGLFLERVGLDRWERVRNKNV